CPYTKTSLNRSHFRMTVCQESHASVSFVTQTILRYRDWFLEITPVLPAAEAFYKTILILFPHLAEDRVPIIIDEIQRTLKPLFVQAGLMIGQFHEKCNEPGLWNQDFRPLHSPLPLLAIRHMVPTDFPFLRHEPVFLEAYLKNYGQQIPQRWLSAVQLQRNLFGL
ncbi:MAG TPA: hypothetical protein VFN35_06545, partial [Ktedonobacteraceae bacterium]|nr:hypothetical protein [Ktedonobacteraceae bacterium]